MRLLGELLIDDRHAEKMDPHKVETIARASGKVIVHPFMDAVFETATFTCSHCQRIVIYRSRRGRDRHWCWSCDHYICSGCNVTLRLTGKCEPLNKLLDRLQTQAHRDLISAS